MTTEQLYKLIEDDGNPTPSDIGSLKALTEQYPYFEIAKFVYLKAIYEYQIQSFKSELSRLGVLLKNRESLFYYIFKDDYAQYFKKTGKVKLEQDKTKLLLDAFFDDRDLETTLFDYETQPSSNLVSVDYLSFLDKEQESKEKEERSKFRKETSINKLIYIEDTIEEESNTNTTIGIKKAENLAVPIEPISVYELEEEDVNLVPLKHQSIIDRFIEGSKTKTFSPTFNKVEIKADKDQPIEEPTSNDENLGDDVFFTETLAKIYTKQKRYEKAYEIIEHLSLKYPKKNSYFADQLRYLEKLIINSKYKNKK